MQIGIIIFIKQNTELFKTMGPLQCMVQLLFLKYLPQYASQEKSSSDLSMSKYNLQRASFGYYHHNSSYIHFLVI